MPITDATSLISKFSDLSYSAVWVLVSVAIIFIVWNAVMLALKGGEGEDRKKYQNSIIWGIVGLAVILSIWGLVAILTNTFGTNNSFSNAQSSQDLQGVMLVK